MPRYATRSTINQRPKLLRKLALEKHYYMARFNMMRVHGEELQSLQLGHCPGSSRGVEAKNGFTHIR